MKFLQQIEKILNYKFKKQDYYCEDEQDGSIIITIDEKWEGNEITFDVLSEISRLLGTRNINFKGKVEHFQYSEYTSDYTQGCEIICKDVKFNS
jgi:hypothetical protein